MLNIVHLHKTIKTMYNISPKQAEYLKNFIVQFNFHVNKISCIYPLKSYKIPYEDNLSPASSTCIFNSIITTKPTKLHNKMQYVTLWFRQLQVKSIYASFNWNCLKFTSILQVYTTNVYSIVSCFANHVHVFNASIMQARVKFRSDCHAFTLENYVLSLRSDDTFIYFT